MARKLSWKLAGSALIASALPAAVVAGVTPASAAAVSPAAVTPAVTTAPVTWRDVKDGRYLQVYKAGKKNNDQMQAAPKSTSKNQKWNATKAGRSAGLQLWTFKNENSSKCLTQDVRKGQVYGYAVQFTCAKTGRFKFLETPAYENLNGKSHFLGWVLQGNDGAICEHTSGNHLTYGQPIQNIWAGGVSLYKNCIWH